MPCPEGPYQAPGGTLTFVVLKMTLLASVLLVY